MRVKQYKGTVYGADLTAKERRAMNIEINRKSWRPTVNI